MQHGRAACARSPPEHLFTGLKLNVAATCVVQAELYAFNLDLYPLCRIAAAIAEKGMASRSWGLVRTIHHGLMFCRGEAYWPRSALSELHTAEQWRVQLGRQVLAEQLERAVKTVPKRGYKPDAMDLEVLISLSPLCTLLLSVDDHMRTVAQRSELAGCYATGKSDQVLCALAPCVSQHCCRSVIASILLNILPEVCSLWNNRQ